MHALAFYKSATTDQLISELKQGLPTNLFDELRQDLDLSDNALSGILLISKRTLDRRRETGRLKTDESDRVLRLIRVYNKAVEVFDDKEEATSWLKKPARGLGGQIPLTYADTEPGAHEVIALLDRIDHGVFPG
ncbi:MAG: antitoxin Xre/MbcA/ParS toxin-binding domain-containing protein [Desulfatitalea sp.]